MSTIASQLECARTHVVDTLTDTCTIKRRTAVSDGKGGTTVTYATLASGVACYVSPQAFGREQVVAGKVMAISDYVVSFEYGQDVVATDRIVWGALTLEVLGLRLRTNGILLQVDTKEIK